MDEELNLTGFHKIHQFGGSLIVAVFWNPETNEEHRFVVRDYDYGDSSRDRDELYNMPIDQEYRRKYLRARKVIQPGDLVEVYKGRKVPIGTRGIVTSMRDVCNKYGGVMAVYVRLDNGASTNVLNCRLVD